MTKCGDVRVPITVSPWLPVGLVVYAWLDPAGSFWPFLLAAAVHELGHLAAVVLCGGDILSLRLGLGGACMALTPLSWGRECLCALAGPAAGLVLGLWWPVWPALGFWAMIHSFWNLLPAQPLDGGRALEALLLARLPAHRALTITRLCTGLTIACLLTLGLWAWLRFDLGIWCLLPGGLLLARNKS